MILGVGKGNAIDADGTGTLRGPYQPISTQLLSAGRLPTTIRH